MKTTGARITKREDQEKFYFTSLVFRNDCVVIGPRRSFVKRRGRTRNFACVLVVSELKRRLPSHIMILTRKKAGSPTEGPAQRFPDLVKKEN